MPEQALNDVLRIVGFAGSLRGGSFNRALLEAARQLAPSRMTISRIEIGDLPFYNADVEAEGDPAAVVEFKAAIRAADGILIATPECNDGIPGVLTTAIDWGSRPPGAAPLTGKPVALMGASPSRSHAAAARAAGGGGARAIRSGAPADARGHAPGPLGLARAVCALDRPGAGRGCGRTGTRVACLSASLGTHRQTDAFVAHVLSWYRWVNERAVSFSDAASPVAL